MKSDKSTTLTYAQARRQLRKVGTNHAQGDALRAMYAALCEATHGIAADAAYEALPIAESGSEGFVQTARAWLRDREACYRGVIDA